MPDKPHRSRTGWRDMSDTPDDLVPGMPFHYHRPPKWIARCIVGLFVLGALNLSGLTMSLIYDMQQQEYIEGRGEYRDAQTDRIENLISTVVCDILGEFPAGDARADRLRVRYDCPIPDDPRYEGNP